MKHAKHTPAPWTVDSSEPSFVHANGYPVSIPGNADDVGSPTAIANARLIASASELLEALATISELLLDRNMGVGNMDDETLCETIGDIVTVAMGKAIGGAE